MFQRFIPDMYAENIFEINYEKLKNNDIKCILFDLDNTISPAKEVILSPQIKELFDELKNSFRVIIFSNNFPKRVSVFGNYYDVDIAYLSLKPNSYKYHYILRKYNYKKNQVAAIGDQLLTDIYGGNKMGFTTILVNPICEIDEKETFINRQIEKRLFKYFKKKNLFDKGKYYD